MTRARACGIARRAQGFQFFFILFFVLLVIIAIVVLTMQKDRIVTVREQAGEDFLDQHAHTFLVGLLRQPLGDGLPVASHIIERRLDAAAVAQIAKTIPSDAYLILSIKYPDGAELRLRNYDSDLITYGTVRDDAGSVRAEVWTVGREITDSMLVGDASISLPATAGTTTVTVYFTTAQVVEETDLSISAVYPLQVKP
jgi:hypothetical protein